MQLLIEETVNVNPVTSSSSKTMPLDLLMSSIKGMFASFKEYREYVTKYNLQDQGYPLDIRKAYGYGLNIDEILGNPYGTYRNRQSKVMKDRQIWLKATTPQKERQYRKRLEKELQKQETEKPVQTTPTQQKQEHKVSMGDVCQFLIDRGMSTSVKNILCEPHITLEDARLISDCLINSYEKKTVKS